MILQPFRSVEKVFVGNDPYRGLGVVPGTRCFVVISKSIKNRIGVYDQITRYLKATNILLSSSDVSGEATIESIHLLSKEMEDVQPDLIFAVGGGGVIDAVKAARVLFEQPEILQRFKSERLIQVSRLLKTKMVVIPSTIGTGSEASSSAVIKNPDGDKVFLISHDLISDYAVLDPNLINSLPLHIRLSTICDALSHSIESYVSQLTNSIIQSYSALSLRTIFMNWSAVLDNKPNSEKFQRLLLASFYAGYSQNHGLVGAAHALAHAYSKYDLSHSMANAIFLPSVIKTNLKSDSANLQYSQLARESGVGDSYKDIIDFVNQIKNKLDPQLPKVRLSEHELDSAINDPGGRANPVPLSKNVLNEILDDLGI